MTDYTHLTDVELLRLLKSSDHRAYTEIYHRYYPSMYCFAFKKLKDEDEAKDVVQEIFTTLWKKREIALNTCNLPAYLCTSVRNRIFDLFSRQKLCFNYVTNVNDYIGVRCQNDTDHLVREKDLKAHIETEITSMSPKMRQIFQISREEHLTHKQIAEKLNTSEHNVSKQIYNALKKLRMSLETAAFL